MTCCCWLALCGQRARPSPARAPLTSHSARGWRSSNAGEWRRPPSRLSVSPFPLSSFASPVFAQRLRGRTARARHATGKVDPTYSPFPSFAFGAPRKHGSEREGAMECSAAPLRGTHPRYCAGQTGIWTTGRMSEGGGVGWRRQRPERRLRRATRGVRCVRQGPAFFFEAGRPAGRAPKPWRHDGTPRDICREASGA